MPRLCACKQYAIYGKRGESPIYCGKCVTDLTMVNVRSPECEFPGCRVNPSYGPAGVHRQTLRCALHTITGDVPQTNHTCLCGKSATHGVDKVVRCAACAVPDDERLHKHAKCRCGANAYWRAEFLPGMPGKARRATHCTKCAVPGMECVRVNDKCLICPRSIRWIAGVTCDFCVEHVAHRPTLLCVEPLCEKLIISTYDKCRKHRQRSSTEAYNPCLVTKRRTVKKEAQPKRRAAPYQALEQSSNALKKTLAAWLDM